MKKQSLELSKPSRSELISALKEMAVQYLSSDVRGDNAFYSYGMSAGEFCLDMLAREGVVEQREDGGYVFKYGK